MTGLRLIVMRHAKSSWGDPDVADHDRPLNKRGRESAPLVAAELLRLGWAPSLVLCSTSARTQETWERMESFFPNARLRLDGRLYHAGMGELRAPLQACAPTDHTVMVLGHNPGWESVVRYACGESVGLTTANAALLETTDVTWPGALHAPARFTLHDVVRPRELSD